MASSTKVWQISDRMSPKISEPTMKAILMVLSALLVVLVDAGPAFLQDVKQYANEALQAYGAPGAVVSVYRRSVSRDTGTFGEPEKECFALGKADVVKNKPMTCDTLLQISSLTKGMTGLLALNAAGLRALDMNGEVRRYFPEFNPHDGLVSNGVSMTDLLSHRTGYGNNDGIWQGPYGTRFGLSRKELLETVQFIPPEVPLRYKFLYNNIMFTAGGQALASGLNRKFKNDMTWAEWAEQKLFVPLGMQKTWAELCRVPAGLYGDFATGYKEGNVATKRISYDTVGPAKSVVSNGQDMLKWIDNYLLEMDTQSEGKILKKMDQKPLLSRAVIPGGQNEYWTEPLINVMYANGMNMEHKYRELFLHHSGHAAGITTEIMYAQTSREHIAIFVAVNQDESDMPLALAKKVAETLVLGTQPSSQWPHSTGLSPAVMPTVCLKSTCQDVEQADSTYCGIYRHPAYGVLDISSAIDQSSLTVTFLSALAKPKFTLCRESSALFAVNVQGHVFRLHFTQVDAIGVIDSILFDFGDGFAESARHVAFVKKCYGKMECVAMTDKWVDNVYPNFPLGFP